MAWLSRRKLGDDLGAALLRINHAAVFARSDGSPDINRGGWYDGACEAGEMYSAEVEATSAAVMIAMSAAVMVAMQSRSINVKRRFHRPKMASLPHLFNKNYGRHGVVVSSRPLHMHGRISSSNLDGGIDFDSEDGAGCSLIVLKQK